MSVYKKLLEVSKENKEVVKNGFNAFNKYKYVTEADVLKCVTPLLTAAGLVHSVTFPNAEVVTVERGGDFYNQATVQAVLEIVDSETGEKSVTQAFGYAHDKNGDKAIYKAQTGASKYVYLKTFGLGSGEDPEADEQDYKPRYKKEDPTGQVPYNKECSDALNDLRAYREKMDEVAFSEVTGFDDKSVKANAGNAYVLSEILSKLHTHETLKGKMIDVGA